MKKPRLIALYVLLLLLIALPTSSLEAQDIIQRAKNFGRDIIQKRQAKRAEPKTGQDDAIENLASEIDWLENYMDEYGSVSAKQPDIWGESRLTKYRHEVEKELSARIDDFALRDNASIVRADIAQLASVISIGSIADSSIADFKAQQTQFNEAQSRSLDIYAAQLGAYQQSLEAYYAAVRESGGTVQPTAPSAPAAPTIGAGPSAPTAPTFALPTGVALPSFPTITPNSNSLGSNNLEPVIELNQRKRYLDHLNQLRRVNEGDDTSDAPGYALNLVRIPVSILPGRATRRGYGAKVSVTAKPITSRTLLPTTFRNLVVNDLVDQLSLPVLRLSEIGQLELAMFFDRNLAVSDVFVNQINNMPGSWPNERAATFAQYLGQTMQLAANASGYGGTNKPTVLAITLEYLNGLKSALQKNNPSDAAELTKIVALLKFEFETELRPETLESEYRQLTGLFIVSNAEKKLIDELAKERREFANVSQKRQQLELQFSSAANEARAFLSDLDAVEKNAIAMIDDYRSKSISNSVSRSDYAKIASDQTFKNVDNAKITFDMPAFASVIEQKLKKEEELAIDANNREKEQTAALRSVTNQLQESVGKITDSLNSLVTSVPASNRDGSLRFPISPAIFQQTYGYDTLRLLASSLKASYAGRHVVWNETAPYKGQIHLLDARKYLNACFNAAHNTISEPRFRELLRWTIEAGRTNENLSELIDSANIEEISIRKDDFIDRLDQAKVDIVVAHHCWCLVVEMAMLNKRLNEDVYEHAITKGDCKCKTDCNHFYYLPMPECSESEMEATDPDFCAAADAFCSYVKCRWPIHVFTIDPVHQEQNVSEASAVKRELSIAAALAFTSGKINMNQLTRFQRQVQEDISTVGLNRTQTGFMHSNDTFGWQFSPRVQTRKPQGTFQAFGETVFGRGADANWKEASLEPGMRECTAIVLMPSFVPYCDFDVRTNWFQINRPTHTDMSMTETMKLSRSVTQMRNWKYACKQCEHLYRPGEMDRLLNRVEQLERMIPLQSHRAQIPYENTLGGFDLFSNGLTDLGPRIEGWYGAPGIVIGFNQSEEDKKKTTALRPSSTSLFLVADNLSVNQTQIIAGGIPITSPTMISREVVQINVPHNAQVIQVDDKPYVAVYIATPYGVTNHLHIPVVTGGLEVTSATTLAALKKELEAKISETPFSWPAKETVDYELCFGMPKAVCEITCLKLTNKTAKFKLEDSLGKLAKLAGNQGREFSLVGALIGPDKEPFGSPVLLKNCQKFNADGNIEWKATDLFEGELLNEIKRELKAQFFEKETKLALKLETYILFKEDNNEFSTPAKIGGEIDVVVILNQLCTARVTVQNTITAPTVSPMTAPAAPAATAAPAEIEIEMDSSSNLQTYPSSSPQREASRKPSLSSRRYQIR